MTNYILIRHDPWAIISSEKTLLEVSLVIEPRRILIKEVFPQYHIHCGKYCGIFQFLTTP